jgi:hypothetical protein
MPMKRSNAAVDRAVDDHRAVLGVVGADVAEVEALGRQVVELDRAELPLAADRVGDVEVDLRAVERAVAGLELVGQAGLLEGGLERGLGLVPQRVVAELVARAGSRTSP